MIPNLITISDFKYPYKVVANEPALVTRLTELIETKQQDILLKILGSIEVSNFEVDFDGGSVPQSDLWLNFLNGETWAANNNNQDFSIIYRGIKPVLVRFIYYYYIESTQSVKMQSGEGAAKFQNSNQIVPDDLIRGAYKAGVDLIGNDWVEGERISDLDEYKPTVFNYLYRNIDLLPNLEFGNYKKLNFLGI